VCCGGGGLTAGIATAVKAHHPATDIYTVERYVEAILGDPSETARLVLEADGGATLFVGTQSNGQGHETVYAGMVAAQTGLALEAIRVVQGDSDAIPAGGGTGGSRSVTVQGVAIAATVQGLTQAMGQALAPDLGPGVTFDQGTFRAPGSNLTLTLAEAADRLRAAGQGHVLDHSRTTRLPGRSYPNGAHWAEVAIDPETGHVEMLRHIVTDDFGVLVHPRLAEGQVQGGVVQGIGQALMENAVHDPQGQPLSATFMDYALPRAGDVPMIRFTTEPVPSTANPLGMKGCGEAGTVGALPAVANAVQDALARLGAGPMDMPFTPHRIWDHLRRARAVAD
ncbi:MAG: molybdopterin-dependent oxidoreductase, partial [Rhodobacterales bacterium]|nr:molybdopterin-dependent oxidoreductase [Rhodobacterales bacterium]